MNTTRQGFLRSRRRADFDPELYRDIPAGYYDHVYARGTGVQWFWHHHRFSAVAEWIPQNGRDLLDLGCGPGTFIGHFAGGYSRALGIDLAEAQIEYARARYGGGRARFEATDVTEILGEDAFDAIVCIEVIEHLPREKTQEFLLSLRRLLKPGGTLVLTTPNYRSLWPAVEWLLSRKGPVNYLEQHINRFNVPRLVREIEAAGLIIRRKRTFFVIAPFLAAVSRGVAERFYRWEQRLLRGIGSEIVVSAEKPRS